MILVRKALDNYYNLDEYSQYRMDCSIRKLANLGVFSNRDLTIIIMLREGYYKRQICDATGLNKSSLRKNIIYICENLGSLLGPSYQDYYIVDKVSCRIGRPLTDEENLYCSFVLKYGRTPKGTSITSFEIIEGRFVASGYRQDKAEG